MLAAGLAANAIVSAALILVPARSGQLRSNTPLAVATGLIFLSCHSPPLLAFPSVEVSPLYHT